MSESKCPNCGSEELHCVVAAPQRRLWCTDCGSVFFPGMTAAQASVPRRYRPPEVLERPDAVGSWLQRTCGGWIAVNVASPENWTPGHYIRIEPPTIVPEPEPEIDEDSEHWSDLNDAVAELAASVRRLSARIADRLDAKEEK